MACDEITAMLGGWEGFELVGVRRVPGVPALRTFAKSLAERVDGIISHSRISVVALTRSMTAAGPSQRVPSLLPALSSACGRMGQTAMSRRAGVFNGWLVELYGPPSGPYGAVLQACGF